MKTPAFLFRLLRRWMPWHVRRTWASARRHYATRKPPFEGVYPSFEAVPSAPPWDAPEWIETSRRKTAERRREIGRALPDGIPPTKFLLPVVAALIAARSPGAPVRILDFGGAAGIDFANLLASLGGDADVRYEVVDTEGCRRAGEELWRDDPRVTFSTTLPPSGKTFDVVYSSGVINVIGDFRETLRRLAAYKPAALLLCRISMHDGPSFVRRQVNMGGGSGNPIWALGLRDVTDALEPCGYVLSWRGYGEEVQNVDNYEEKHRVGRMVNLLFVPREGSAGPREG